MTFQHPWYIQQQLLENTTTCESESTPKPAKEDPGQKPIRKCCRCKRWDHASNLINGGSCGYYHLACNRVEVDNRKKIKQFNRQPTVPRSNIVKCPRCGMWDKKENLDQYNRHPKCQTIQEFNRKKLKQMQSEICDFTGLPFGTGDTKPNGDHDHETLLYRGTIWASANRYEGAVNALLANTGWTLDQLFEATRKYFGRPGIDIGLKPYPQLGFKTYEEALANLSTNA